MTFATVSNRKYTSLAYCYSTEKYFYPMEKEVAFTSKDNGGKPVNLALNFAKAFDDIKDNADVLKICGVYA